MRVLVHDRTQAIPTKLLGYGERSLQRLGRHLDRIAEIELEFESESKRTESPTYSVHITVRPEGRRHALVHVHETGLDPRSTLDLALDKIDRQVVRLKEKMKQEPKRAASAASARTEQVDEPTGGGLELVRLKLRPQSLADAAGALEEGDRPFWVYLDEASGMVNVCYRRPDGGLTVIEPVLT